MSKKYEEIAQTLAATRPSTKHALCCCMSQWHFMIDAVANVLKKQNPRFDHSRFVERVRYLGVGQEDIMQESKSLMFIQGLPLDHPVKFIAPRSQKQADDRENRS